MRERKEYHRMQLEEEDYETDEVRRKRKYEGKNSMKEGKTMSEMESVREGKV